MNRTATAAAAALLTLTLAGCGTTTAAKPAATPTVTRTVDTVTVPAACTQALDLADDTILELTGYIGDDVVTLLEAISEGDTAGVDQFTEQTDALIEDVNLGEYTALRDACRDVAAQ